MRYEGASWKESDMLSRMNRHEYRAYMASKPRKPWRPSPTVMVIHGEALEPNRNKRKAARRKLRA